MIDQNTPSTCLNCIEKPDFKSFLLHNDNIGPNLRKYVSITGVSLSYSDKTKSKKRVPVYFQTSELQWIHYLACST